MLAQLQHEVACLSELTSQSFPFVPGHLRAAARVTNSIRQTTQRCSHRIQSVSAVLITSGATLIQPLQLLSPPPLSLVIIAAQPDWNRLIQSLQDVPVIIVQIGELRQGMNVRFDGFEAQLRTK